jgi:hypothetical protein
VESMRVAPKSTSTFQLTSFSTSCMSCIHS